MVLHHTEVLSFPKLLFELINIHFLELMLWNVKIHCMR